MSENRKFRSENDSKSTQGLDYFIFLENLVLLKIKDKRYFIFRYKNRNTYQYHVLQVKMTSEMCQEMASLDLGTPLRSGCFWLNLTLEFTYVCGFCKLHFLTIRFYMLIFK